MRRQGKVANYMKAQKVKFARGMRNKPTPSEKVVWEYLRDGKLGVKFRRQSLVLGWIADFYSPTAKLVVELDGHGHDKDKDRFRDRRMKEAGLSVIRFSNEEVRCELQTVIACIQMMVEL